MGPVVERAKDVTDLLTTLQAIGEALFPLWSGKPVNPIASAMWLLGGVMLGHYIRMRRGGGWPWW